MEIRPKKLIKRESDQAEFQSIREAMAHRSDVENLSPS